MTEVAVTEADFRRTIIDYARLRGWRYYCTWLSLHSPKGFPDFVLLRARTGAPPRLIFAEIKSERGRVRPEQADWLADLREVPSVEAYLWRPSDFDEIVAVLT